MPRLLPIIAWPENYQHYVTCEPVVEITTEVCELAEDMMVTMEHNNGIGLAAPQVGREICLIVVKTRAFPNGEALVNPRIVKTSKGKVDSREGCLSFPDKQKVVKRHSWVAVEYQDLSGELKRRKLFELDAFCVQHEIDHLLGISIL